MMFKIIYYITKFAHLRFRLRPARRQAAGALDAAVTSAAHERAAGSPPSRRGQSDARCEAIPLAASATHLVLIPSYNTRRQALRNGRGGAAALAPGLGRHRRQHRRQRRARSKDAAPEAGLRVLTRGENGGKGAAVLDGLRAAEAAGFTHVLVMDADGQHPAASIGQFHGVVAARPEAMILGVPVFDATAPRIRVIGRRVSNSLARIETLGAIGDSLFGFRIYPIAPLRRIMEDSRFMRRFDFDVEAAVRLCWQRRAGDQRAGGGTVFRAKAEGGVSHFRYARDNLLLARMHAALARRLSPAPAAAPRATAQIIPPLMPIICPEM